MSDEFSAQRIKHLEMIQNIISRMNNNSFSIKKWSLTIIPLMTGFGIQYNKIIFIILAIVAVICFALLDSIYLQQERKYIGLYQDCICSNTPVSCFDLSTARYKNGRYSLCDALFSKTIVGFYFSMFLLLVFVAVFHYI